MIAQAGQESSKQRRPVPQDVPQDDLRLNLTQTTVLSLALKKLIAEEEHNNVLRQKQHIMNLKI